MTSKKIAIIGGNGGMGQLFYRLLQQIGHKVVIIERHDWEVAPSLIMGCQLVIVSVPIQVTLATIERVAPLLDPECILADFTSLKVEPLLAMLSNHPGPVVGLHPMFGPTITSTNAQVIVVCNGRAPSNYAWLLTALQQLGFTLQELTTAKHDQAMSFIQGVEHFITFSLGTFLHHKGQHPDELLSIASPIYLAKLLLLGRIFDQDPELYADIIMADPQRLSLIKEFAHWLTNWATRLENGQRAEFIAAFTEASNWMGEFTSYAQNSSDEFLNRELPTT
jgi:prephenate dehydrogenase